VAGKDSHGFIGSDPNTGYANTVRAERYLGSCVGAFVASSGCSCFSCRGRGVALGRHGRGGAYRVEGVQRRPRRAAVRPRRGPAGLVAAWRSDDLAVGDPPTGQPAGAADRVVVRVNFGGPGVAGVATVKRLGPRLNRLGRGRFDVVSWDPRGVGESTRISCFANDRDRSGSGGRSRCRSRLRSRSA
jgi:hypothetical protein